jgi:cytochrome c-type biogenesis protein CcmH/NrfG
VALNAEFAEGQFQLGLALEAQGELTEAIACYREAVRLQPGEH